MPFSWEITLFLVSSAIRVILKYVRLSKQLEKLLNIILKISESLLFVLILWWVNETISIYREDGNLSKVLLSDEAFGFLMFPLIMTYLLAVTFSDRASNILHKPFWGMKKTVNGYEDESLTKYRKVTIGLVAFIVSLVLIFIGMVLYGLIRY